MHGSTTTRRVFLRQVGVLAGAVAGGGLLAACQPTAPSAAPSATAAPVAAGGGEAVFKLGVVTSLSGEDVFGGNVTRRGYDFWAETINKQGGVDVGGQRYKVQLVYADDQSKPATGADAAERMINQEKVDVILGPYTSGVTLAVAPITEKYKVPMLAGSAESPNVWKANPKYTFGIIPSVDLTAGKSLGVLVQQAEPKSESVAVIGVNEPFSKEAAEGFLKSAQDLKLNIVKQEFVPSNADLTPIVSSVAAAKPDIVAVGGHEEILINFVKAAKSLNFAPKAIIMHYGVTVPDFAKNLGKDAEAIFGLAVWTPDVSFKDELFGTAKDYAEAARNRWGSEPDYTEAACSASGLVFQAAVAKVGKKPPLAAGDREALNAAIEQVTIQTFYGPIKFTTEGEHFHDNTEPVPVLVQVQNGGIVSVGPANAKRANMVYPLPAWNTRS
jgi:branched-chain amino acid transport system substrate-binding protein